MLTLPDENTIPEPVLWLIVELFNVISSISNSPPDIFPVVEIVLEPVSIFPNPEVILPEFNADTAVILFPVELLIAKSTSDFVYLSLRADFTLVSRFNKWLILSLVTQLHRLIFNSAAVEVTAVPLILIFVAWTVPAIFTIPLDNEIKSKSSLWPIVAPLATTLPILNDPPLIELLPISMFPNPFAILPELNGPTVTILDVPVVAPNAASASALVYLFDNSVLISVVPILSEVAVNVPSTVTESSVNVTKLLFPV